MRRLGAVVVALACAASMWGAGAAAADPVPGPGVTLTEMGYWSGAIDDQMTVDAGGTAYASIGVAAFDGRASAEDMLIRADLAMYDAKATGRDALSRYA